MVDRQTQDEASQASALPPFMPKLSDASLHGLSSRQVGFIVSMRNIEESMNGNDLKEFIAELFPPAHLFSSDLCDLPSIWVELRNFLDSRGAGLQQHSSRRVILTLAHGLYHEAEDRIVAIEMANRIIAAGRRVRMELTDSVTSTATGEPSPMHASISSVSERTAHNVAMRLKDNEKKFSGDLGECWHEYVDEYNQISKDYNLTPAQKLQYFHNVLSKDAHRFYLDRVQSYATSFHQAVEMIDREYNSPVRQARVKNYLNSLRVSDYVAKGTEISMALTKVYRQILQMSRQVPISHQGDAHRIEFLRGAVIGYTWSHEPLSRVATQGLTFQQLYGEIEAALQLHKESQLVASRDDAARLQVVQDEGEALINFTGQGRYLKPYRDKNVGQKSFDPLSITGCFNCEDPSHVLKDCPKPLNIAKAAAQKLEYLKKKRTANAVHLVLADICFQMDKTTSSANIDDDLQIFQSLVAAPTLEQTIDNSNHEQTITDNGDIVQFCVEINFSPGTYAQFEGACIDSGAQLSCIGKKQAMLYCRAIKKPFKITKSDRQYKFGNIRYRGLGDIVIRLPVSNDHFAEVKAEVVDVDVPFLLGLDALTQFEVILNFGENTVVSKCDGWSLPLKRKLGHVYIEWVPSILYTERELRRVHRNFYHPQPDKLYALLKRAHPDTTNPGTLAELEKIQSTCDVCQREADAPYRFRVSLPHTEVVFNRIVSLDLMKLNNRSVLHAVDRDTKFSAACFLNGETTLHVWQAFLRIWVTTYVGYPDTLALDQGPQFSSEEWKSLAHDAGISLHQSGVESHNAIGSGERYHSFLRRIFNKVITSTVNINDELALAFSVKACNDMGGTDGLVPTLLVFGSLPRIPIGIHHSPDNISRMKAISTARREATKVISQHRLDVALNKLVPGAANNDLKIADEVLMYREKPVAKWVGPYIITSINGKQVTLDTGDRTILASIDKLKLYRQVSNNMDDKKLLTEQSHDLSRDDIFQHELNQLKSLLGNRYVGDEVQPSAVIDTFVSKLIDDNSSRAQEEDFVKAKQAEILGLQQRKIWKTINRCDVPTGSNILGGRFVLTLKNVGSPSEGAKARYVAQGYRDDHKNIIVHDTAVLRVSSIRMILSAAAVHKMRIFSCDVSQAYLQSKDKLSRSVYIQPKRNDLALFGIKQGQLFELIRPLYGLCDAGDYWGHTIIDHLVNDIKMTNLAGDPCLFVKTGPNGIEGITGLYVDDCLNAGHESFQNLTTAITKQFDCKPRVYDKFDFFGSQINTLSDGSFSMSQEYYAKNLNIIPSDVTFEEFRKYRALFSWMIHTRPDMACYANRASQVTEKTFGRDKIRELNQGIKIIKRQPTTHLKFTLLDKDTAHMRVYADAAFATNDDLSSQIGFVIFLCDIKNTCHILDFSSKKSRRIVRSIMAGEVCAFMDAFDVSFMVSSDISNLLGITIPVFMFTDSKQLFDSVTKGKRTTEKRLMIDISAARESYKRFEIEAIGLIKGSDNPADDLSKINGNGALKQILDSGFDETPVVQWIERDELQSKRCDNETGVLNSEHV